MTMISNKKALSFFVFGLFYATTTTQVSSAAQEECQTVDTVENFDLTTYISKPWYSHQQATNFYSPIGQRCTRAIYTLKDGPSGLWGYTVDVLNTAVEPNGEEAAEANLCAYQEEGNGGPTDASKLGVAPCFIPKRASGPYWVVAYNEEEGYALISVGQPTRPGTNGGCLTGNNDRDAGLWIFSRSSDKNQTLIDHVRGIASDAGFDITVLNDVDHVGCDYPYYEQNNTDEQQPIVVVCEDSPTPFTYFTFWERDCEWVANNPRIGCLTYSDYCPVTCGECSVEEEAADEGSNINVRKRKQL